MLYIMRHGKTDWNADHCLQGQTDIPLNAEGRQMAERAFEEYKDVNIDICYCSPLIRAVETAHIVCRGRDIPVIEDARLKEMGFGIYEGTKNYMDQPDFPLRNVFVKPEAYKQSIGGAETFEELFARTGEFLDTLVRPQLQAGKDVLIVGHGAMNASIVCRIRDLPIDRFWDGGLEQCKMMRLL